ncbi:molybdenum cofactor biosynthesis protein MoaE [soil metagenome]
MIDIAKRPIDISQILASCEDRSAGATVLFTGSVRDHNNKENVSGIYYETYEKMAKNVLLEIENEVLKKWTIKKFIAIHRIGNLKVNEISVAIAVATEHRQDAFEACRYTINNIKTRIPIWKKELSESGEATWEDGITPFNKKKYEDNKKK